LKTPLLIALALTLLPLTLLFSVGTAHADTETERSLNGRLLTTAQMREAMASNGVTFRVAETNDVPDVKFPQLVSSGRQWITQDGSYLAVFLLSYIDGRSIPASRRDEVLSGQFAKDFMGGFFDSYEYLGELEAVSENDILHGFNTRKDGTDYQTASISFIRGNIFGIVVYATADNELVEVISAFGGQTAKLPE
jgi:hypothetical protein